MVYRINWSKWRDPLAPLINIEKELKADGDFSEDLLYSKGSFQDQINNLGPAIVGPMGIVPIHESNLPGFLFNFWIGHTNFRLTEDIAETIDWIDGIEAFDVFTPYRFRIGIGKMFDEDIVKKDLENKIILYFKSLSNSNDKIGVLKELLKKQYKFWIIVILENNKIDFIFGLDKNETETKLHTYKQINKNIKKIILSWE